jgi:hypothetical protein
MNNMTIRLRMLAYATAAAVVSLAFLTPYAAFAAQPKSSIYGTPAQLVEDLQSAGIDIGAGLFTKPDLLASAVAEKKSGMMLHRFANGSLRFNEQTGEFKGFSLLASQKKDMPIFPLASLSAILALDGAGVLARYGSDYATINSAQNDVERFTYYLLAAEPSNTIWNVMIALTDSGKFSGMVASSEASGLRLVALDDIVQGLDDGGEALLYKDLWSLGLGLGAPSSQPDIIGKGVRPDKEEVYDSDNTLEFGSSIVTFSPDDKSVESFIVFYANPDSTANSELSAEVRKLEANEYPLENVKGLILAGPKAFQERYGPGLTDESKPKNYGYGLLLEVGDYIGICTFNIEYESDGDDSVVSFYGQYYPYRMYRVRSTHGMTAQEEEK